MFIDTPKVGQVVYGCQIKGTRPGELQFLCSTQSHIETTIKKAMAGAMDTDDEDDPITEKDLIVYELRRIK